MPKKYFKKFLPSHESVRGNRSIGLCTLGAALSAGSYFAVRGAWRLYTVTVWRQRQRARRDPIGQASHK